MDKILDGYLKHITDAKHVTARQCIKLLPIIAKHKPELKNDIVSSLCKADISVCDNILCYNVLCELISFILALMRSHKAVRNDITAKENISVQGATNDIKKCFRYAEWKSQIFHSIFTYSLVALIDEIRPSVAFLLSSKLIFSQSSK